MSMLIALTLQWTISAAREDAIGKIQRWISIILIDSHSVCGIFTSCKNQDVESKAQSLSPWLVPTFQWYRSTYWNPFTSTSDCEYWMSGIFSSLVLTFTLRLFNLQQFWNSFCLNNLSDQLPLYRLVTWRGLKILTLWIYHLSFKSLIIKRTRHRQLGLTFHILKLGLDIMLKIIPEVYILLCC